MVEKEASVSNSLLLLYDGRYHAEEIARSFSKSIRSALIYVGKRKSEKNVGIGNQVRRSRFMMARENTSARGFSKSTRSHDPKTFSLPH